MRIYKNKWFSRYARRNDISDSALWEAVERAERGLIDANLGGGVIKQRIARPNEGRSGGFRSIVLFRAGERSFFVFGFAKNERDNIDDDEERAFKNLAEIYLNFTEKELQIAIEAEIFIEVEEVQSDDQDVQK